MQVQELIGYAHRLSFTTSAPPGFIPGQTPLVLFKPPAPQEGEFRASALHEFQSKLIQKVASLFDLLVANFSFTLYSLFYNSHGNIVCV